MKKFNKNEIIEDLMNQSNQSTINEGVYKTIVDKEVERKYVFYKSHGGKLEYEVLEMDPNQVGGWEKDGPIMDDVEWLEAEAEDSKLLADFLKKEGIIKESRLNQSKDEYPNKLVDSLIINLGITKNEAHGIIEEVLSYFDVNY